MPQCSQCNKMAIVGVGDENIPLCIDCYLKFQQAIELQDRRLKEMSNFLMDHMESTLGVYSIYPRYPIRQPISNQKFVSFNNINIDNSVIGVINTGEAKNIDINISLMQKSGNGELAEILRDFTQKIIEESKKLIEK